MIGAHGIRARRWRTHRVSASLAGSSRHLSQTLMHDPLPEIGRPERLARYLSPDRRRLATGLVVLAAVILAVTLISQFGYPASLRGDSDYYLRDAATFARGEIPHSRYSPGFALVLSPLFLIFRNDLAAAGNAALGLNLVLALGGLGLTYRFLREEMSAPLAAALTVVFAVCEGVSVYFAEVRPEPLVLVLLVGGLIAWRSERPGLAIVLGGLATFVRVAVLPFVLVAWVLLAWGRPRRLLAITGLLALGVFAHLATAPVVQDGYADIATSVYVGRAQASSAVGVLTVVANAITTYLRVGFARIVWPFALLQTGVGVLLAAGTLFVMSVGALRLFAAGGAGWWRRRAVIPAALAGLLAYQAALIAWPIRDLAAIRMLLPVAPLGLLVFGTGLCALAAHLAHERTKLAVTLTMVVIIVTGMATTARVIDQRARPSSVVGLRDFIAVQSTAATLPPGPILSPKPATTELVTGRVSYRTVRHGGLPRQQAEALGACIIVFAGVDAEDQEARRGLEPLTVRTVARRGLASLAAIDAPWCQDAGDG